jgi:hypothetical protein
MAAEAMLTPIPALKPPVSAAPPVVIAAPSVPALKPAEAGASAAAATPAVTTVTTTATTIMMITPTPPQPPPCSGGGGGAGSVGSMCPITSPGLYGRKVLALLWMLVTLLGTLSTWPLTRLSLPSRLFACASRYHMAESPHRFSAMPVSVSPVRTV